MKKLFLILLLSFCYSFGFSQQFDSITDTRDGITYKTVKIGKQVWMAENLNYDAKESWCYDDNYLYCKQFGRLYSWKAAQKACPLGWHLPSKVEFETLLNNYKDKDNKSYYSLKKGGSSGFSVIFGGWRNSDREYFNANEPAYFWSSTPFSGENDAWFLNVDRSYSIANLGFGLRTCDYSVRCLKDSSSTGNIAKNNDSIGKVQSKEYGIEKKITFDTLTDSRDGKIYKTIKIGNQDWMAENLAFNSGKGCWGYDIHNYGYFYDWETAKNVCPKNWRLPSKADFDTLLNFIGGENKYSFDCLVLNGNTGFSALLGGWRHPDGNFNQIDECAFYWSSSSDKGINVWSLYLSNSVGAMMFKYHYSCGFSVRCIKEK